MRGTAVKQEFPFFVAWVKLQDDGEIADANDNPENCVKIQTVRAFTLFVPREDQGGDHHVELVQPEEPEVVPVQDAPVRLHPHPNQYIHLRHNVTWNLGSEKEIQSV